jgi:hypothetical protein
MQILTQTPPTLTNTATGGANYHFEISRNPISTAERAIFQTDLQQLGLDDTAWDILNRTLETGTRDSLPQVLRVYDRHRLIGVAFFVECRRVAKHLLPQRWLGNILDLIPIPMFFWVRYTSLVDATGNPGFVAPGIDREEFAAAAIAYLRTVYLYGGVIDEVNPHRTASELTFTFCDAGIIDLADTIDLESWLTEHKNLKRKINKFKNKNGTIEILRGAMPPEVANFATRLLNSVDGLICAPFQDNYTNMAIGVCTLPSDRLVHILAKLDNRLVGYQSFVVSDRTLYCLSGVFDRTYHTTYHAYENIILKSIEFALDRGLDKIEYGIILNPTKAKMMNAYRPCAQHYYYRWSWMKAIFAGFIPLTRLAPKTFIPYANLAL